MADLVERYARRIWGVLSCYDRVIIRGQVPGFAYVNGMESFLASRHVRLFDFTRFAMPLRETIRDNARQLAQAQGIEIQFIRHHDTRKQDVVAEIIKQRGEHPGLVAILSALELCPTFEPRYDTRAGRPRLRPDRAKCLHYYFYFIDEDLGLCFLRVPTWCPFGLQFYFNGHNVLAAKLRKAGIEFSMLENCFTRIADWEAAQKFADESDSQLLHAKLDHYAQLYCPVIHQLGLSYQWNLAQIEYSTDIVFRRQVELCPIFDLLVRTAIHAVRPADVGTFLGRRLLSYNTDDLRNVFHYRIDSCCLKHRMGPASIKMQNKFGIVLRIETTTHDPSWFSHYRTVAHRDGTTSHQLAPLKKSIYSLFDFRKLAVAANRRYLAFISALDDPTVSVEALGRVSQKLTEAGRSYRGLNFFSEEDLHLFEVLVRGEYAIRGLRNANLRQHLPGKSSGQVSRMLKRLWMHGLVKKVGGSYKYYITEFGRTVVTTGLKLKNLVLIPELAHAMAA